jgi:hypothetical protein
VAPIVPVAPVGPEPAAPQLKLPVPSVINRYPLVPPVICKLLILPNDTLAVFAKLTMPPALLTVNPVKLPNEVTFGCAFEVEVKTPLKVANPLPTAAK